MTRARIASSGSSLRRGVVVEKEREAAGVRPTRGFLDRLKAARAALRRLRSGKVRIVVETTKCGDHHYIVGIREVGE